MKVLLIGCGVIGSTLLDEAETMDHVDQIMVFDTDPTRIEKCVMGKKKASICTELSYGLRSADLVMEAASQEAVRQYLPEIMLSGIDIIVLSVGAFSDDKFTNEIKELSRKHGGKVLFNSGAITSLDGLQTAMKGHVEKVCLTTIKNTSSFQNKEILEVLGVELEDIAGPVEVFRGSARDAAHLFQRNINVSAVLSITGIGFDRTKVIVIADPSAERNTHRIEIEGDAGTIKVEVSNLPHHKNSRTSMLAILSAVKALKQYPDVQGMFFLK